MRREFKIIMYFLRYNEIVQSKLDTASEDSFLFFLIFRKQVSIEFFMQRRKDLNGLSVNFLHCYSLVTKGQYLS